MQSRVDLGVLFWVWARFKLVNLHGNLFEQIWFPPGESQRHHGSGLTI